MSRSGWHKQQRCEPPARRSTLPDTPAAGSPPKDTMLTTPVQLRTRHRAPSSNRAKQYPGKSGQSTFFFRSFQVLHRGTVGRNDSTCLVTSSRHTNCSCRDRVQSACQLDTGESPRSLSVKVRADSWERRHVRRLGDHGVRDSATSAGRGIAVPERPDDRYSLIALTGERSQAYGQGRCGPMASRGDQPAPLCQRALPDRCQFAVRRPQCVANSANSTRLD